jgi:hypothetical protein
MRSRKLESDEVEAAKHLAGLKDPNPYARATAMHFLAKFEPRLWLQTVLKQIAHDDHDQCACFMILHIDDLQPSDLLPAVATLLKETVSPIRQYHLWFIARKRGLDLDNQIVEDGLASPHWQVRLSTSAYCISKDLMLDKVKQVLAEIKSQLAAGAIEFPEGRNQFTGSLEIKTPDGLRRSLNRLLKKVS